MRAICNLPTTIEEFENIGLNDKDYENYTEAVNMMDPEKHPELQKIRDLIARIESLGKPEKKEPKRLIVENNGKPNEEKPKPGQDKNPGSSKPDKQLLLD